MREVDFVRCVENLKLNDEPNELDLRWHRAYIVWYCQMRSTVAFNRQDWLSKQVAEMLLEMTAVLKIVRLVRPKPRYSDQTIE